ncbi:MAG: flippase-like domain-containing protein [bacterium]
METNNTSPNPPRITAKQLKSGMRIFFIITTLTVTVIFIFTASKETLSALKQVNYLFLGLTTLVCILRLYFECLRLQVLGSVLGKKISLKRTAEFTFGGYFLSILPFGVGGLPLQFYILMKEKFSFGESGTVIVMRGITYLLAFVFAIPVIIYYRNIFESSGLKMLSGYILVVYSIFLILFTLAMWKTEWIKTQINKLSIFFILKHKDKLASWINKLADEIENFKLGFKKCCTHGIYKFLLVILLSGVSLLCFVLMVPLLFRSLGVSVPIVETSIIQFILTFLLMFSPSPGGSGIAEGAGFLLFNSYCPKCLMGVFIVLWRFFTYYTGVIIGGIFILKLLTETNKK